MQIKQPQYFEKFHCIGGTCEDNCCIGWDVEIDQRTYKKYRRVKDRSLSLLFREKIFENPDPYNVQIDYALVELGKGNRCPFLNDKNLCKIQGKIGEEYLSNVCATYPRMANEVDGIIEYSATVSCPEAAKLILGNPEKMRWVTKDIEKPQRTIVNYHVDTKGKQRHWNLMVSRFHQLRDLSIETLQNRNHSLENRLKELSVRYEEFEKEGKIPTGKIKSIIKMMEDVSLQNIHKAVRWVHDTVEIDSQKYKEFAKEAEKGFGCLEKTGRIYQNNIQIPQFILENYLVNYIFQELFPLGEGDTLGEAFMALAIRYGLIQYHLLGIGENRGLLKEDTVIEFIQTFSKAVEHHHVYLSEIKRSLSR
ncbi:MAG: flagellin lysine-N-methylase [Anaerovorax sp.]